MDDWQGTTEPNPLKVSQWHNIFGQTLRTELTGNRSAPNHQEWQGWQNGLLREGAALRGLTSLASGPLSQSHLKIKTVLRSNPTPQLFLFWGWGITLLLLGRSEGGNVGTPPPALLPLKPLDNRGDKVVKEARRGKWDVQQKGFIFFAV